MLTPEKPRCSCANPFPAIKTDEGIVHCDHCGYPTDKPRIGVAEPAPPVLPHTFYW